ncbi:hypothetical protein [Actinopolyspora xinjiangensis]|nr:hypothetical protein [Actinopolyspora xinjiangensis]
MSHSWLIISLCGVVLEWKENRMSQQETVAHPGTGDDSPPPVGLMDPSGRIDLRTPEGAAIFGLFRRIKVLVEEPDGSWPGGDLVEVLNEWLADVGLDPDEELDNARSRLETMAETKEALWTVAGLRNQASPGETLIAAVFAGQHFCRDSEPGDEGGYQRVVDTVTAEDADEAERLAYELFESARDE